MTHSIILPCVLAFVCVHAVAASPMVSQIYPLPLAVADTVSATTTGTNRSFVFSQRSTFEFVPATGNWVTVLNASGVSTAASAAFADQVVIVGGGGQEPVNTCSVFHASLGTFTACATMPNPRGFLAAAAVGSTMYVMGGFAPSGWDLVSSYDFTGDKWTADLKPLLTPRYGLSAAAVGGRVFTFGGVAWHVPASGATEMYLPSANTWTEMAPMITPRSFMAVSVINDLVYLAGGNDGTNNVAMVEVYNPTTNAWTAATPLPKPTRSHFSGFVVGNTMIVTGGSVGKGLSQRDVDYVTVIKPIA